MDQGATWHRGRPLPRRHCVRWGPSSSQKNKGAQQPPLFVPCLLWSSGRPSQQLLSSCPVCCKLASVLPFMYRIINMKYLTLNNADLHQSCTNGSFLLHISSGVMHFPFMHFSFPSLGFVQGGICLWCIVRCEEK